MSRFLIQSVIFDDDGVITVTYLDKDNGLRRKGALFGSGALSVTPDAGSLYGQLRDIRREVEDTLVDLIQVYRDEPPFVPEEQDEEDDHELGMGF